MPPFAISLQPGESPYRQIVYAATKAIVTGDLEAGAPFPSVRELSHDLKINPNTAQKVIAELTRDGMLEVRPGIGTIVATGRRATASEKRQLLSHDVERLIVEAKRMGLTRADVTNAVLTRWDAMFASNGVGKR